MPHFEGCRVRIHDARGALLLEDDDLDLRLEGDAIGVLYHDDEGPVIFAGTREPGGAFRLVCRSRPRVATLALRDGAAPAAGGVLEGEWSEGAEHGRWRIELG